MTNHSFRARNLQGLKYNRYRAIGFKTTWKNKYKQTDMISAQLAKDCRKQLLVERIDSSFRFLNGQLFRFMKLPGQWWQCLKMVAFSFAPNLPVWKWLMRRTWGEVMDLVLEKSIEDPYNWYLRAWWFLNMISCRGLQNDLKLLKRLSAEWEKWSEDPKLEVFVGI